MAFAWQYGTMPGPGADRDGGPLAAYGTSRERRGALPGGLSDLPPEISYSVHVRGGLQLSSVRFNVHFSGACGKRP